MFQKRDTRTPGRGSTDRTWNLVVRGGAALLAVLLVAFGLLYWFDQRTPDSPSMNERAISQAEAAVRKAPNSVEARLTLAEAYELENRFDDALAQIDQILKLEPDNRLALLGQGYAYFLKGDFASSATSYEGVIANSPSGEFSTVDTILQEARYYLGTVQAKQGKYPEAKESLAAALRMNPTDADALYQLGAVELATGNAQGAVDNLTRALTFVPTDWPEPWTELAKAYTALGDQPHATHATAMATAAAGKPADATKQLQTLIGSPVEVEALLGLGMIAQAGNDDAAALQWFEKALVTDPENAAAKAAIEELKGAGGHGAAAPGSTGQKG